MFDELRYLWRRQRARHYLLAADLEARRWPSPRNLNAVAIAADYARRVEVDRPYLRRRDHP